MLTSHGGYGADVNNDTHSYPHSCLQNIWTPCKLIGVSRQLIVIICMMVLCGCQPSHSSRAETNGSATNPTTQTANFNVVVVVVHGMYDLPAQLRPKALGGHGNVCPQLEALLAAGLQVNDLQPTPHEMTAALHPDTKKWLQVVSHGSQVCALFGTAVDPGVAAGADWWVGQANSAGGLPQRDNSVRTLYTSHFPVRRLGMTAAVPQTMTRPWLLQICDEIGDFILFQARAEAPFAAVVELNVSNMQLQKPDETTLNQRRINGDTENIQLLARMDMADQVISHINSELVWYQAVPRTMYVLVANDGPPGTKPLLVFHWPDIIAPGTISLPDMSAPTLQKIIAEFIAGKPIKKGALPAALEEPLNKGLRHAQFAAEEKP